MSNTSKFADFILLLSKIKLFKWFHMDSWHLATIKLYQTVI